MVTISFLDQEKSKKLASPVDGITGSVVIDSIDNILEAEGMFNYTCDRNACVRFELLCLVKALFIIQKIISILNNNIF